MYEAIKVIEAWGLGFHLGSAVKYIARAGKKPMANELEDLQKAKWYLERRIAQLAGHLEPDMVRSFFDEIPWPAGLDLSK